MFPPLPGASTAGGTARARGATRPPRENQPCVAQMTCNQTCACAWMSQVEHVPPSLCCPCATHCAWNSREVERDHACAEAHRQPEGTMQLPPCSHLVPAAALSCPGEAATGPTAKPAFLAESAQGSPARALAPADRRLRRRVACASARCPVGLQEARAARSLCQWHGRHLAAKAEACRAARGLWAAADTAGQMLHRLARPCRPPWRKQAARGRDRREGRRSTSGPPHLEKQYAGRASFPMRCSPPPRADRSAWLQRQAPRSQHAKAWKVV